MRDTNTIIAVVTDLMFMVKIQNAAKQANLDVAFVKSDEGVLAHAHSNLALIVLDLNTSSVDVLALISRLKTARETSSIPLLGFVSHVNTELIKAAQAKGCDTVMARSSFSQKLPDILRRYA